jgi:hypothetical protein
VRLRNFFNANPGHAVLELADRDEDIRFAVDPLFFNVWYTCIFLYVICLCNNQ